MTPEEARNRLALEAAIVVKKPAPLHPQDVLTIAIYIACDALGRIADASENPNE